MIPKLYSGDTVSFRKLGLAALSDAVTCEITEERNGIYELMMEYPVTGRGFDQIEVGMIIVAKPNETSSNQAFQIYQISKPMDGLCTINAEHISYRLNWIVCQADSGYTRYAEKAMNDYLKEWALQTVPFTFSSDIGTESSTVKQLKLEKPMAFRTALAGMEGSVLDLFGGEYEWDNWNVILHQSRGSDNGVRIKYGKNLTGLKVDTDISEVYTAIDAYYIAQDKTVTESGLVSITDNPFSYHRAKAVDASSAFDSANLPADLQTALQTWAAAYLAANNAGVLEATVEASFYPLWQSSEYAHLKDLEQVSLCDTVTIVYEKLGVNVKAKVIRTVYDCLRERYTSITIGKPKINIVDAIKEVI